MTSRSMLVAVGATAVVLAGAVTGFAQRPFFGGSQREPVAAKPTYDGRFTFARLKYTSGPGGYYYRGLPAWRTATSPTAAATGLKST
jgi:hypothetical protein